MQLSPSIVTDLAILTETIEQVLRSYNSEDHNLAAELISRVSLAHDCHPISAPREATRIYSVVQSLDTILTTTNTIYDQLDLPVNLYSYSLADALADQVTDEVILFAPTTQVADVRVIYIEDRSRNRSGGGKKGGHLVR